MTEQVERVKTLLSFAVGSSPGSTNPEACMRRLLALETPEDAKKIRAALEKDWQKDWAAAFNRAANKVFGL